MPMKVTVCFDNVRVIVPCGDGELLVRELIEKAITRYKKATGKGTGHLVEVHNLKTTNDGGILDPDDHLNDVVDDREQLIADYEEHGRSSLPHNGGDGASASSTGTTSPDIFQSDSSTTNSTTHFSGQSFPLPQQNGKADVIVTSLDLAVSSSLKVRRGSEPALNNLPDEHVPNGDLTVKTRRESVQDSDEPRSESDSDEDKRPSAIKGTLVSRFARDSLRQSLSSNPDMYKWLEAQERQEVKYRQEPQQAEEREGPVGGSAGERNKDSEADDLICLKNNGGPLGIHVIPDYDENGRDIGLVIQGIEQGGRIHRDGRLKEEDLIVEINGVSLLDINFAKAQEIFRNAMKTDEIRLRIAKGKPPPLPKQPPPVLPKPRKHAPHKPSPLTLPPPKVDNSEVPASPVETSTPSEQDQNTTNNNNASEKDRQLSTFASRTPASVLNRDSLPIKPAPPIRMTSPTKKTPPAVPMRHPSTALTSKGKEQPINTITNTRKIGKKIPIQLKKGPLGLGFSITSRDIQTGGNCPIYIKNILAKGAAISDGQLKPGDRLLEVNDVEMTGKTQSEAVAFLRNIPQGAVVNLVVSRQEAVDERFKVPRELDDDVDSGGGAAVLQHKEKAGDDGTLTSMKNKEVLMLDIPLNETGSAGLGVSVKGKTITTDQGTRDLGIVIKSIMHGGAASKDGRLLINDQLLEVNGENLVNISNMEAMDRLRQAMQKENPSNGHINLTISRMIGAPSPFPSNESSSDNSTMEFMMQGFSLNKNQSPRTSEEDSRDLSSFPQDSSAQRTAPVPSVSDGTKVPNLMLERLMEESGLRNDSYIRATRDNFGDNSSYPGEKTVPKPVPLSVKPNLPAPTVTPSSEDIVIIEDDTYALPRKQLPNRPRPHSTIGFAQDTLNSSSGDDQSNFYSQRGSTTSDGQESDLSPVGDPMTLFQREGFGRQSISEKRKGHIDPKGSEYYQKAKSQKETKGHQRSNLLPAGGRLSNLKRASSLEDLSAPGDTSVEDEEVPVWRGGRIGRPRACNDSFRAAVDRSYDPPTEHSAIMDTLEEESTESGSVSHGQSNSARSSFSSENTVEDSHGHRNKKKNKEKKSGGIFKGFLRLGKGRKSNEDARTRSRSEERPSRQAEETVAEDNNSLPSVTSLPAAEEDLDRLSVPHRPIPDQPLSISHQRQSSLPDRSVTGLDFGSTQPSSLPSVGNLSRTEKIQQLRAEHQRRHKERQGQYPLDAHEEYHERKLQEEENERRFYQSVNEFTSGMRQMTYGHEQMSRPHSRPAYGQVVNYNYFPSDYLEPQHNLNNRFYAAEPQPRERGGSYGDPPTWHHEFDYHSRDFDYSSLDRRKQYNRTRIPVHTQNDLLSDPNRAYRDPLYPTVAGRRPVQTLTDPGSAKV